MNGELLTSVIGTAAALVLATRGLRSRPTSPGQRLILAGAWLVIIVGVTFILHSLGFGDPR